MDTAWLIASLVALAAVLFLSAYLTRPRSLAWHMKRVERDIDRFKVTLGQALLPAFVLAAEAMEEFSAALRRGEDA